MKKRIVLLVLSMSFLSVFGQKDNEITKAIESIKKDNEIQEAINKIAEINRSTPDKLTPYSKELSEAVQILLLKPEPDFDYYNVALQLCETHKIKITNKAAAATVKIHKQIRESMNQTKDYHSSIWDDEDYLNKRSYSGLILDLMGYFSDEKSIDELKISAIGYLDFRLKQFAVLSLLKRGESIEKEVITKIAADDEARQLFYNGLGKIGKQKLFPKAFLNQRALSKSDMVNWLIYPTELARVPTEIELIKVITLEYEDVGAADFYLWKFRSDHKDWKKNSWMVGLSGPFLRSESPTTNAQGYTFSAFEKLKEKKPDAHFDAIMKIMEDWYKSKGN